MELVVPKVGLTVEFATVVAWHKAVGDEVAAGEAVVEVSVDKAEVEVEAPEDGVLLEIRAQEGEEVGPGQVLGVLGDGASEPRPDRAPAALASAPVPPPAQVLAEREPAASGRTFAARGEGRVRISPAARRLTDELGLGLDELAGTGPDGRIVEGDVRRAAGGQRARATPVARRMADELGVDLSALQGSGRGGRVRRADVREAARPSSSVPAAGAARPSPSAPAAGAERPSPSAPAAGAAGEQRYEEVAWTAARRVTARRLALSAQTVAPVTLHRRVDAGAALDAVRALKAGGLPATFTHAVLWATARALREHPALNAVWEGERLLRARRVHLAMAVDVDGDLLVGVLPDAGDLELPELVPAARAVVERVRQRRTAPHDAQGTFSVTSLGMFGVEAFTPIVNPPQVAVLGVGAAVDELALAFDGLRCRPRCALSLTFDHRAVDGAPAARFLRDVCALLEGVGG